MATLGHAITFTVGSQTFAVTLDSVQSIEPFSLSEKNTEGPSVVLGVTTIRDEMVMVLDPEMLLFEKSFIETEKSRLLITKTDDKPVAIAISEGEIIDASQIQLQSLDLAKSQIFSGVVAWKEKLIPVIHPSTLVGEVTAV